MVVVITVVISLVFYRVYKKRLVGRPLAYIVGSFSKPRACTLVNFTGETKNFLDCLIFAVFL